MLTTTPKDTSEADILETNSGRGIRIEEENTHV